MPAVLNEQLISAIKKMLIADLFVEVAEDRIELDDGLHSVLGLDSVGMLELRVLSEARFGVRISDDEFGTVRSIRTLADLIERLRGDTGGAS